MNSHPFILAEAQLCALETGALWWEEQSLLCVSDLHLGKSERIARKGGASLPPYDTHDTLSRLSADIARTDARTIVCLGDSFDDLGAALALQEEYRLWIMRLQAGRRWTWIEGNHDPGPTDLGGSHMSELVVGPLTFRHIAAADGRSEISGHYHPKARVTLRGHNIVRAAFLVDGNRTILPAYGTYTGGLDSRAEVLCNLMQQDAKAVLTGKSAIVVPMPR